jgi:threonine dehydrogenase-like Zn-dependent dehydrogenase
VKAVRGTGAAGGVRLVEADEPGGEGELIAVRSVSICASDLRYLAAGSERIIGHEVAGVTADGTPVVLDGVATCGRCGYCTAGRGNLCPVAGKSIIGLTVDGGLAGYCRAPRHALLPLPAGLSLDHASLAEPAAVAWHACGKAGVSARTRVAVVGAGAIGLLAVLAAGRLGAPEVSLLARHPYQRDLGMRFGATAPSGQYDAVIEASGSESGLAQAVELARPQGIVSTVTIFPADVRWPYRAAFLKEVAVVPSMAYDGLGPTRELGLAAAMLAADPDITKALITHRFGIDEAPRAFELAAARPPGTFKVVIHP